MLCGAAKLNLLSRTCKYLSRAKVRGLMAMASGSRKTKWAKNSHQRTDKKHNNNNKRNVLLRNTGKAASLLRKTPTGNVYR